MRRIAASRALEVERVGQHEANAPEGMVDPAAFEGLKVHPELESRHGNLFQHRRLSSRAWRAFGSLREGLAAVCVRERE